MPNKESKFKISNELKKAAIGTFLCLLSIYLSLNLVTVFPYDFLIIPARAINWLISFFVGGIFSYIIYLILFIYGITIIFYKKKFNFKWKLLIIGVILFCIGGMILLTNSVYLVDSSHYLTFTDFGQNLVDNVVNPRSLDILAPDFLMIDVTKNSGLIGMTLTASINSLMTYIGSYALGSIIFVAGIVLLLIRPTIYLVKKFNEYRNFNYQYSAKENFTKAKDITITTTTLPSLEDSDNIDIETTKVSNAQEAKPSLDEIKQEEDKDFLSRLQDESQKKYVYEKPINQDPTLESLNFEDRPVSKAHYDPNDDDSVYTNIYRNNNVTANSLYTNKVSSDSVSLKNTSKEQEEQTSGVTINNYGEVKSDVNVKPTFDYLDDIKDTPVTNKKPKKRIKYVPPSLSLLENRQSHESDQKNKEVAEERSDAINQVLSDLGVKARVVSYKIGPSVTRYDIQTEKNVSIKGFDTYLNDISIRLGGISVRFSPIVLGKTTSGLEIANQVCSIVNFKDCLQALNRLPKAKPTNVPFGKDINNELITIDLQETPHLLVCGSTGSGKSVFMHSLIMSLIMRNSPENLKLLLIDPKTVEFIKYREIPHLLCPPVDIQDPQKPFDVLNKICDIMEERYSLFAENDVSKLKEYNEICVAKGQPILPIIVVIIDEYADLVDVNKRISEPVVRIGQKARAAGIHMIIATQRPSVNVINGVIKANIPSRVALLTSSPTDSMTIIDQGGAEKLIGNGDMLIKSASLSNTQLIRCQGSFVSNQEIKAVCDFLRTNYGPQYDEEIMDIVNKPVAEDPQLVQASKESRFGSDEDLYQEVKNWTMSEEYISMSRIQTTFSMGFNRASRIFKRLQQEGVVSDDKATNSSKGSKVLIHNYVDSDPSERQGTIEQTTFKKF